jgi:hypothetical protein
LEGLGHVAWREAESEFGSCAPRALEIRFRFSFLAHKTRFYEGPLVNKSPGVNKPPLRGPPKGPEEGTERYQHFEEIVGALRVQIFRAELMHNYGFSMNCDGFLGRKPRNRVAAKVRGAGVNKLRAKIGGNSLGAGGFY